MPDDKGEVVVSQVEQIGEILGDFVPAAKPVEIAPVVPVEPVKLIEPVKPAESVKPVEPVVVEPVRKGENDETIKTLVEQIKTLTTKVAELSASKPAEPVKPVEPVAPVSEMGFFKDKAEYELAFEKPEVMSEVMGRVRTSAVQDVLKSLPQVINNVVKAQIEVQTKTAKFYSDNEDLIKDLTPEQTVDRKKFIGYVANDVSGKNPDWTLDKLFTELPGEVKRRLGLKAATASVVKGPAQPPKKGGVRVPDEKAPELTSLETEIQDLM